MAQFAWGDSNALTKFFEAQRKLIPPLEVPEEVLALAEANSAFKNLSEYEKTHFLTQTFGQKELLAAIVSGDEYKNERQSLIALHVETLLDQAADLLDRTLRSREKISSLKVSFFQNIIDLWEFWKLDAIHALEIDAGRYSVTKTEKQGDVKAMQKESDGLQSQQMLNSQFLDWFAPKDSSNNRNYGSRIEDASKLAGASASQLGDTIEPDTITVKFNKIKGLATRTYEAEVKQKVASLSAEDASLAGSKSALDEKISSQTLTQTYLEKAEPLQLERVKVARQIFVKKVVESFAPGGALNYGEQIAPIARSAERDVAHALARLSAVDAGMTALFGYSPPFPGTGSLELNIDNCVNWARDAVSFLRTFMLQDVALTVPISLKSLVGEEKYNQTMREAGDNLATFSFVLPEPTQANSTAGWQAMLRHMRHVRLRGVSASVEQYQHTETWQVGVQAPRANCKIRHLDGTQSDITSEQKKLPMIWLGRVNQKSSSRAPEVAGTTMLLNATPFGEWQLSIATRSLGGKRLVETPEIIPPNVSDIQLELLIAGRATAAG